MKNFSTLIIVSIFLVSCGEKEAPQNETLSSIAWMEVNSSSVNQIRKLAGELVPELGGPLSFGVQGQVIKIPVALGDKVKKGQILAQLDTSDFQNDFNSARSDLANKASLYKRMLKARKSRAVSQQEVSDAKNGFDMATAALAIKKHRLDDTDLRAPYDGIITSVDIDEAERVNLGQQCFMIDSGTGLEVDVSVPENMVRKLIKDKMYKVEFPAIKELTLNAKLTEVGTQARRANAFPVTLALKEQSDILRSGMTAQVHFNFSDSNTDGILVPNSAVGVGLGDDSYVFIFDPSSSTLKKVKVKPINITNNDVYVKGVIKNGDIIATAGIPYLSDGQKVKLLEQNIEIFN
jgi:multidrug efflux system membrane fusion protein